jgi:hypothetical protein
MMFDVPVDTVEDGNNDNDDAGCADEDKTVVLIDVVIRVETVGEHDNDDDDDDDDLIEDVAPQPEPTVASASPTQHTQWGSLMLTCVIFVLQVCRMQNTW